MQFITSGNKALEFNLRRTTIPNVLPHCHTCNDLLNGFFLFLLLLILQFSFELKNFTFFGCRKIFRVSCPSLVGNLLKPWPREIHSKRKLLILHIPKSVRHRSCYVLHSRGLRNLTVFEQPATTKIN